MLGAVARQYNDILLESERDYLRRAFTLSADAQRLYARLLTRKGPLIRIDSLEYREVCDLGGALAELEAAALVQRNPTTPADRFLERLTRDELDGVCFHARVRAQGRAGRYDRRALSRSPHSRRRRRGDHAHVYNARLRSALADADAVLRRNARRSVDVRARRSRRASIRDATAGSAPSSISHRRELDDFLAMHALREPLRRLECSWQHGVAVDVLAVLWRLREPRACSNACAAVLVNQLGRCAERAADYDVALSAYGRASRAHRGVSGACDCCTARRSRRRRRSRSMPSNAHR